MPLEMAPVGLSAENLAVKLSPPNLITCVETDSGLHGHASTLGTAQSRGLKE